MSPPRRLHPQVEALRRERLAGGMRPVHELSVHAAREAEQAQIDSQPPERVAEVVDLAAGDVPLRLYLPDAPHPLPVLVYFFGGGWVLGSLDNVDPVCRRIANAVPCAVCSVSYRRAPEHRFPAAVEDGYAAVAWVAAHGAEHALDTSRIAVGGASAGGNLAAVAAQLARDRGGPPLVFQLLVYPPVDHGSDTESMQEPPVPPFFSAPDVAWCWSHYLADAADGASALASPLKAESLTGLPPALVITAELDPLRDEAELYAACLQKAGVPARLVRFDGMMHGFFSMSARFDAARDAQALAASALRDALAPKGDPQ